MTRCVFLSLLVLIAACKKKSVFPEEPEPLNTAQVSGLPEKPQNINGFLYSSIRLTSIGSSSNTTMLTAYASFNDPFKNLARTFDHNTEKEKKIGCCAYDRGNVSVGGVFFNNDPLVQNALTSDVSYITNKPYVKGIETAEWSFEGNQTFTSLTTRVFRGYPR